MIDKQEILEFQTGIFELRTRRFGTVAELMIQKMFNLKDSTSNAYDLRNTSKNERIEVKFSTVMRAHKEAINEHNVIEMCKNANLSNRMLTYEDLKSERFDCNIQQVKRVEFDILYYGMFLLDKILIFKVHTRDITRILGYSDFQHRGNEGEGQFHINNSTIDYHLENHLIEEITYEELYKVFETLDN